MKKPRNIILGPIKAEKSQDIPLRMAILLWGPSGAGKTTFAASGPGIKLWLSFGDNEHVSIMHRDDVIVADFSALDHQELIKHAKSDNPFGLDKALSENPDIETVVFDSLTAITFRALQQAVHDKIGAGKGFTPTMEAPGISAYGGRNAIVLSIVTGILRVTHKHGVHCIFTAHEADPTMKKEGQQEIIDYIGIQLGGQLVNGMTWRLSEIWHLRQSSTGEKNRILALRPTALRKPMKTRMFTSASAAEFPLTYDADKADKGQMTIASWHEQWEKNGCRKLPIPKLK